MAAKRFEIEYEDVSKWLIEEMAEEIGDFETDPVKCTITDLQNGESESAVGDGKDDALEKACRKMGIKESDLDEYLDED